MHVDPLLEHLPELLSKRKGHLSDDHPGKEVAHSGVLNGENNCHKYVALEHAHHVLGVGHWAVLHHGHWVGVLWLILVLQQGLLLLAEEGLAVGEGGWWEHACVALEPPGFQKSQTS